MRGVLAVSAPERERAAEAGVLLERRATAELVGRLTDSSWVVRRAAVSALARVGDDAVEPLCRLLTGDRGNEVAVAAAVDALASSLGDVEEAALRLVRSPDPAVACDGAQILGRRRASIALHELSRLMRGDNDNVALAALEAVGRIGGEPTVELLLEAVQSQSFFRVFPAIDLLGKTGDPRAVRPLAKLLEHPHYALEAARALGRTAHPGAVPLLAALLSRPSDADVRVAAVALVAIHDRYVDRFGSTSAVPDALRAIEPAAPSRRLARAAADAESSERWALCRVLGWVGGAAAIDALVGLLDADPDAVRAPAAALAGLGREGEPELLRALRTSGSERRLLLLPIVGRRRSATADVIACLDDPNRGVRALACDTLGRIGDPAAIPVLFEQIGDADARVSQGAVAAIQAIGGAEVQTRATEIARSDDRRARRPALRILATSGSIASLPLFLAGIGDPDDRIRDVAANGLAAIDAPSAVAALLGASSHASSRTRVAAVRALSRIGAADAVRPRLLDALSDPDAWVRYYAVQALGGLGDPASAEPIGGLLDDPARHVRVAAIDALARLQGDDALGALHDALESDDADVVRAALMGLGIVRSPTSLARLREAVRAKDPATRLVALSALAEFDAPAVIDELGGAAFDSSDGVRRAAIDLLAARPGASATKALVGLLGHSSLRDRLMSSLATVTVGRLEGITAALGESTSETAPWLVAILTRMRRPEAQLALQNAFALDNVHARRAVAPALLPDTTSRARELLEQGAQMDPDEQVRRICAALLGD